MCVCGCVCVFVCVVGVGVLVWEADNNLGFFFCFLLKSIPT